MESRKELVTIIVQRKDGRKALAAAMKGGAPAATYFHAQGTGVRQRLGFLGLLIEAEKQVILIAVPVGQAAKIIEAVTREIDFTKPGRGFAFVQAIDQVVGYYGEDPE